MARQAETSQQSLAAEHRRLALYLARRWWLCYGGCLEELRGEALVGLCQAARRYDANRGCKFSFYASRWISRSLTWFVHKRDRLSMAAFTDLSRDSYFDPEGGSDPAQVAMERDEVRMVRRRLRQVEWEVVWAHLGEGRTQSDIGQKLGMSQQRVRQLLERALGRAANVTV